MLLLTALLLAACSSLGPEDDNGGGVPAVEPLTLSTDRAAYVPGETVTFTMSAAAPDGARVRYKHLGEVVDQSTASGASWQWVPPGEDFRGYMVEVYRPGNGAEEILAAVAIDVSSDWTRFPRYGFLSHYGQMEASEIESVIGNLNRHHINGIQFYDWHHAHHEMLPGTRENPQDVWRNIFNEEVHLSTVESYIEAAHERGMNAMFYNLIYGALDDAASDGIKAEWYLYTDPNHDNRDRHSLPQPPFVSDIYLTDPANEAWRDYLAAENDKVYAALDFDGFHMDQLGDRGTRYAYDGTPVDLAATYEPFITAMHEAHPSKHQVLNAVNQYGQAGIVDAPTDFLYTEVWHPNESFDDLAQIILDNNDLSEGEKNTVLTAYVNYDLADHTGVFNTPSVLFTNAVIFAFGGAHLELGEHMLGKEFFPNDNLAMRKDLREALVAYYDFLIAYQNLLRDGGTFNQPDVTSSGTLSLNQWPPRQGQVSVVGKEVEGKQVIHLLNFTDATTMSWRDNSGTQAYPYDQKNIPLSFAAGGQVEKVWYATPDHVLGTSKELAFTQAGGNVAFTLPHLKYWSMVVVEYVQQTG